MKNSRTLESILDLHTGKFINAEIFFSKPIDEIFEFRYQLDKEFQENNKRHVCIVCKQYIKLRGFPESKKIFHFAHLRDSEDCPIKTENKFTREEILRIKFNGAKESKLHILLKNQIAKSLNLNKALDKGITEVHIEKVYKDKKITAQWKKPDITAKYKIKDLVFELQLSTTFLSVIVERELFYKKNKTFVLWIFNKFEHDSEKRKFTQSDVFYNNNHNAYEYTREEYRSSQVARDLILKCHFEEPFIEGGKIEIKLTEKLISLNDLNFDEDNFSVFYFDYKKRRAELENELLVKKSVFLNLIETSTVDEVIGYFENTKITKLEKQQLIRLYTQKVSLLVNIKNDSEELNIIWAIICLKFTGNSEQLSFIKGSYEYKRIIIDIVSLKLNKIIGYNFKTYLQVIHAFLERHKDFMDYYLDALKKYGYGEYLNDKKIITKINRIIHSDVKQQSHNEILDKLLKNL